ncbi:MAG: FAD-binding and (Fe-S)-binding domain-containing protein [Phycisphaerales bacterium]
MQPLTISDDAQRSAIERALRGVARGELRFSEHDRMLYATDASIYQVEPLGVAIPADTDDLRTIMRVCHDRGVPVLPRGGGTSLAGQCVASALVIDCSPTMRALLGVDTGAQTCDVEPGLTIDDLNTELARRGHGLFFAPDPSTAKQCAIGGAIGNNAAGTRSIKYGRTIENVDSLDLMLSDGHVVTLDDGSSDDSRTNALRAGVGDVCRRYAPLIRERFPKTLRRNAGFALDMVLDQIEAGVPDDRLNLTPLIAGAEGCLGFVTRARLKLHPVPRAKGLAVVGFPSLDEAIASVRPLLELGPSAVELLDDLVVGLARKNIEYARYVELMPRPGDGQLEAVLYVEFFEDSAEALGEKIERVRTTMADACPRAGVRHIASDTDMEGALKLRKAGEPLLHALPGERKPLGFIEDNAVPVERLGEFVTELRAVLEREGTRGAFYAHASVGVLHVRPLLSLRSEEDKRAMERIAIEAAALAKRLGGVMSGEHGDGRARGPFLEAHYGPELMSAFREVKSLFDPKGLFNPGNIVDPGDVPSIHERTRIRPGVDDVRVPAVGTHFSYETEDGFDHAVELCNGAGVCRKTQGGTMCPSYMATLDERHSTRGRANALRLAITGQLDRGVGARWDDPDTLETLDLCLSCKACKTECPSNVDVAQYKAEYLAQSYASSGKTPLKARVFGRVRALNRLGSAFAPVSNMIANSKINRALVDRVLGLAPERTLPAFDRSLFVRLAREAWVNAGIEADAPVVVLYADCFTTYNEPRIGLASVKLLNACGYRVEVPRVECCGRAAISTGLLEEAKRWAEASAERLSSLEREPVAVLACEPSCLSAITDEWRAYAGLSQHQRNQRERLAGMADLVERFVDERWDDHPRRPVFRPVDGAVVLHGHCHQKALWGAESSASMLRRAFGDVRVLDTGCCGMAGSFGYSAHRYALSMEIGELELFPRVRELSASDVLVAPGTSCRHQIVDGTGREAVHPVELLADRLA